MGPAYLLPVGPKLNNSIELVRPLCQVPRSCLTRDEFDVATEKALQCRLGYLPQEPCNPDGFEYVMQEKGQVNSNEYQSKAGQQRRDHGASRGSPMQPPATEHLQADQPISNLTAECLSRETKALEIQSESRTV